MKPTHTPLALLIATGILLAGCAAQKKSPGADTRLLAAAATHQQAAEALASRRFTIELDEIFLPSGKWANINNSFISMQGSRVEVAFSSDLLRYEPGRYGSSLKLHSNDSRLKAAKRKKTGDAAFTLTVSDDTNWKREYRMEITLFHETDECTINVFYTLWGDKASTLRGRVITSPCNLPN